MFIIWKNDYFQLWFLYKSAFVFLVEENIWKLSEIKSIKTRKRQYFQHYWSDNGFKGTVVNQELQILRVTWNCAYCPFKKILL